MSEYAILSLVANLSFILKGNNRKSMVTIEAYSSTWNYLIMMMMMTATKTADTSCVVTSSRPCVKHFIHIMSTDSGNTSRKEILL